MDISTRLRQIRKARKLSQREVQRQTGLGQALIAKLENGYRVPRVETLTILAQAYGVPLYYFFYDAKKARMALKEPKHEIRDWASQGRGLRQFTRLKHALARLSEKERALVLFVASEMASSKREGMPDVAEKG